jgi:N-acetylglutamate synthase-like GNAT family acetyltransferase
VTISVRPATSTDIPWLLEQLEQFGKAKDSLCSLWPDPNHATSILETLIEKETVWIAEKQIGALLGQAVGFIAGLLSAHPYNPAVTVLSEMVWWVEPRERMNGVGQALLDAFTEHGRKHANRITVSIVLGFTEIDHTPLLNRGFKPHELSFLYEVRKG